MSSILSCIISTKLKKKHYYRNNWCLIRKLNYKRQLMKQIIVNKIIIPLKSKHIRDEKIN